MILACAVGRVCSRSSRSGRSSRRAVRRRWTSVSGRSTRTRSCCCPPSLDDWLPQDHLARFVADLVDEVLDLGPVLADYTGKRGYPPYDPRLMLRLLIYGYTTGVRSSRTIERKRVDDIAFRQSTTSRSDTWPPTRPRTSAPCPGSAAASTQARPGRIPPPQGHRRTGLRTDRDLPERPPTPPARRRRGPRRVATAGRLPQPPQGLPKRRNNRTRRPGRLTIPASRPRHGPLPSRTPGEQDAGHGLTGARGPTATDPADHGQPATCSLLTHAPGRRASAGPGPRPAPPC